MAKFLSLKGLEISRENEKWQKLHVDIFSQIRDFRKMESLFQVLFITFYFKKENGGFLAINQVKTI